MGSSLKIAPASLGQPSGKKCRGQELPKACGERDLGLPKFKDLSVHTLPVFLFRGKGVEGQGRHKSEPQEAAVTSSVSGPKQGNGGPAQRLQPWPGGIRGADRTRTEREAMRSLPSECSDRARAEGGHYPKPKNERRPCTACRQSAMTGLVPKEVNSPSQNKRQNRDRGLALYTYTCPSF